MSENSAIHQDRCDLLIIGGGINGVGIARDAAGRGHSVVLVEQDDLAGFTSSASTKLIHGGLRYLEYYEFSLVRESLREREVLLKAAPHIIQPLRFVIPHAHSLRPKWLVRLGLFLYDHLGGRKLLPPSKSIDLTSSVAGVPLRDELRSGFEYSDCRVDDSRLVVLNALAAARSGASIRTRTRLVSARRSGDRWEAITENAVTGARSAIYAKVLVNASGASVDKLLEQACGITPRSGVRLVKGSHIVVPRHYDGAQAYMLQNPDRRIVFVIPYEDDFTMIGTTETDWTGDAGPPSASPEEVRYLCDSVNRYFKSRIEPRDVVWSFSGVRPLYDDQAAEATAVTRDYVLELDAEGGAAPVLSVFGGKITTYRRLAQDALDKLAPHLETATGDWTEHARLPGSDLPALDHGSAIERLMEERPFLGRPLAARLIRTYGSLARTMLGDADSLAGLGISFGAGLYQREVDYLVENEWAMTARDILFRRTKLGLRLTEAEAASLEAYLSLRRDGLGAADWPSDGSLRAGIQ